MKTNFPGKWSAALCVMVLVSLIAGAGAWGNGPVYVYGSRYCGYCVRLVEDLKREGIAYDFFDVRDDQAHRQEMWAKIRKDQPLLRTVNFPVVDAGGKVMIRPSLIEVKQNLASAAVEPEKDRAATSETAVPAGEGWDITALDTAKDAAYLTRAEKDVVMIMNKARTNPPKFAQEFLASRRSQGSYADECYREMMAMQPVGAFLPSRGLSAAAKMHAIDMGSNGRVGHTGTDGSTMGSRISRHGRWNGSISENCSYGHSDPLEIVLQLLIDQGVTSRGHRKNILRPGTRFVGVSIQPHRGYRFNCVQDFAQAMEER